MYKKKLWAIAAVLLAAVIATGVAAWLSDGDTATNAITTGKVDIRLLQTAWVGGQGRDVKPNTVLTKDPHIQNVGLNDAYVFIQVDMAALPEGTLVHSGTSTARAGSGTPLFTTQTGSGLAFDNANWTLTAHALTNGRITQVYAYAKNNVMTPLTRGQTTTPVFEKVRLANVTDISQLRSVNPNIVVTAYAIQTTELDGGVTAPLEVWNIVTNYQASR